MDADSSPQIQRLLKLDALRQRFETAWRAGQRPSLQQYLDEVEAADRETALADLLGVEVELRQDGGEQPQVAEYRQRFPQHAAQVLAVFGELQARVPFHRPSLGPGTVVGDFRLGRELGRGGMGIVYEAEQLLLGRRVALKVLAPDRRASSNARARFVREARAAASLHHTNIVPVLEVGEHEGTLFYAMQLIRGRALSEVLAELRRQNAGDSPDAAVRSESAPTARDRAAAETPAGDGPGERTRASTLVLPWAGAEDEQDPRARAPDRLPGGVPAAASADGSRELRSLSHGDRDYWQHVARIGRQVAEALQYAHERGILHRDIKPANLLVTSQGTVWVTDFGLAKMGDSELTAAGDVIGTLRYLAPEAIAGRTDARSDVYSLGLTLYELLTLRSPFAAEEQTDLIRQIQAADMAPISQVAPCVPRDLATIVGKATRRDPRDRYQTAQQLAEDLERFLRDQPILAREHSRTELLVRWARRNPAVAGMTGALALLLVLVALASAATAVHFRNLVAQQRRLAREREVQRQAAEAAAARAKTAELQTLRGVADLQRTRGLQHLRQNDPLQALLSSVQALEQLDQLPSLPAPRHVLSLNESLRFRIAALLDGLPPVVARRTIEAYDWRQIVLDRGNKAMIANSPQLQYLPDGQLGIVSKLHDVAFRWHPETDGLQRLAWPSPTTSSDHAPPGEAGFPPPIATVFTRDTQYAVRVRPGGQWELWACAPERLVCSLEPVEPDAPSLLDGDRPPAVQLPRQAAAQRRMIEEDVDSLLGCWVTPDGRWLLAGLARYATLPSIVVWDARTGRRSPAPPLLPGLSPPPLALQVHLSRDGRHVSLAGSEARVFDVETGAARITAAQRVCPRPLFSPCGRFLIAPSSHRLEVRDLDLPTDSPPVAEISLPLGTIILAVAGDATGRWVIAGTNEGQVHVVDLEQRCLVGSPILHSDALIEQLEINPRADAVAVVDAEGTIRVWAFPSGLPLTAPLRHEEVVSSLAWRDDGRHLAAALVSGDITVWDLGRAVEPARPGATANRMLLSPDGRSLLAWAGRTGVSLWDLTSGRPRETAQLPVPGVVAASWSPDGHQVALVLQDTQRNLAFHLWQPPHTQTTVLNLNSPQTLNFHDQVVGFTDAGRKLAFGGNSGPVVFDIAQSSASARFALSASRASDPMQFAVANRWIACGRRRNSPPQEPPLQVWTATGALAFQTPLPSGAPLRDLAFSPDDSLLAAIGDFGLRVWRSDDWQALPIVLPIRESRIDHLCFDAASSLMAVVDSNSMCWVAQVREGLIFGPPFYVPGTVRSLSFSPDGKRLAFVTIRRGVTVWDWYRGEPLTPAYGQEGSLSQVRFAPTGSLLALTHFRGGLQWLPIPLATTAPLDDLVLQVQRTTGHGWSTESEVRRLTAAQWRDLGRPSAE